MEAKGVLSHPKRSFKYFLVFLILGTLLSIMVSFFLAQFNAVPSGQGLIAVAAVITLASFFFVFQALLVRNFQFYLWTSLVEGAALFTYFYEDISSILVFAAIVFIWSMLSAHHYGRRLLKQRIDFSFLRFAQVVSAPAMRAFALFISIFYVGLYASYGLSQNGFNFFLDLSSPFVEHVAPEFSSDMNANDFYVVFARNQIERKFSQTEQFKSLSVGQRDEAINTVARELRNKVGEFSDTTVEPEDTVGQHFYKIAVGYLPKVEASPLGILSAVMLALAIYSILSVAAIAFRLLFIVPLAWIFYQALFGLGIVKMERKMIEKDELNLA